MNEKKLVIVSIQEEYLIVITKQIKEIFGEDIKVKGITVKDLTMETVKPDEVVMMSNSIIVPIVRSILSKEIKSLVARRGINYVNLKKMLKIPKRKNILVVNDTQYNTEEAVKELRESVFGHNYYPYYPDEPIPELIDFVVTPGEKHLIPKGISNVIDIGMRVLDIDTILDLCEIFKLEYNYSLLVKRYMKSLVSLTIEEDFLKEAYEAGVTKDIVTDYKVKFKFEDIISNSEVMKDTVNVCKRIAKSNKSVCIIGEAGTGKSMIAQAIHNESSFKNEHFISINCAANTFNDLERELFGAYENENHILSIFDRIEKGSLCLEEIGKLPMVLQEKLVEVLKNKNIIDIYGEAYSNTKLRLITTSSINLLELVNNGLFREDLFYIIADFICRVPSLRERKEDFEPLVQMCLNKYLHTHNKDVTRNVMETLKQYSWEGNVKELFDVIFCMAASNEKVITEKSIPYFIKLKYTNDNTANLRINEKEIIEKIDRRGFLKESIAILKIFKEGKEKNASYGRNVLRKLLEDKGFKLTDQQLRLRLEVLNELNLLIVRQGRLGTTISKDGEIFIERIMLEFEK